MLNKLVKSQVREGRKGGGGWVGWGQLISAPSLPTRMLYINQLLNQLTSPVFITFPFKSLPAEGGGGGILLRGGVRGLLCVGEKTTWRGCKTISTDFIMKNDSGFKEVNLQTETIQQSYSS